MTRTTTLTLHQAGLFADLSKHLAEYSELPTIHVTGVNLQIARRLGALFGAQAVLAWAKTLGDATLAIGRLPSGLTQVEANGLINGTQVSVWDTDDGDIAEWIDPARRHAFTPIAFDQLELYVATGTVAGIAR